LAATELCPEMVVSRLRQFEVQALPGGLHLFVARSRRSRLLGLALLARAPPGSAVLLPRCRSVHTAGMRFALDVVFLDGAGNVLRAVAGVPPWRVVSCRDAVAVLEVPAAGRGMIPFVAEEHRNRLVEALDPRRPIYRDTYNEYFVMALSAGGAAAGTQVPLYIVMAITGLWSLPVFVVACVVFELAVIFGVARPQMKPIERVGWAALWGATTALLAIAFYELVAKPTL
jgi:uncharacterized membrane protein (UPF0127 family)